MIVMTMVDEGLQDSRTYEDLHVILYRIKVEMLPAATYKALYDLFDRWRSFKKQ
jgi:hypothetical protein